MCSAWTRPARLPGTMQADDPAAAGRKMRLSEILAAFYAGAADSGFGRA